MNRPPLSDDGPAALVAPASELPSTGFGPTLLDAPGTPAAEVMAVAEGASFADERLQGLADLLLSAGAQLELFGELLDRQAPAACDAEELEEFIEVDVHWSLNFLSVFGLRGAGLIGCAGLEARNGGAEELVQ